jgi:hypothetical protein
MTGHSGNRDITRVVGDIVLSTCVVVCFVILTKTKRKIRKKRKEESE